MKKSFFLLNLIIVFSIFAGCTNISDLRPPKKVTVKFDPKYEFCMGDLELDLNELFPIIDEIKERVEAAGMVAYDYNPGELSTDLQQVLIKKTIQEIPIDMNSYFKNSSITEQMDDFSFEQEIEVPAVTHEDSQKIDLSDLNNQIVSLVKIGGLTTGGSLNIDLGSVETDKFDTMSFSSGNLVIKTVNDYSGNTVNISYGGNIITRGEFVGNTAVLDLTGKTLNFSGMSIDFFPKRDGTFFVGTIDGGKVNKVTGLSLSTIDVPLDSTVDTASAFNSFESCTVAEGDAKFSMITGDGWKNIDIKYPITLSGGINGVSKTNGTNEQLIDLANKTLTPAETKITSTISISCKKDGEIDFNQVPTIKTVINLSKIESLSVLVKDFETKQQKLNPLPAEFMKTVKQIEFGKVTIPVSYVNTLPEGNDAISVKFVSKFLGIDDEQKLSSGKEQGAFEFTGKSDSKISKIVNNPVADDEFNSIDFDFNIKLPGTTAANPNLVTLKNVKPGEKYKIGLNVDKSGFNPKWNKINIDTSDYAQKDTINTELNLGSMLGQIGDMLEGAESSKFILDKFDFYLFASKPDLEGLSKAEFKGKTVVYTDITDENKRKYMLGSATDNDSMKFSAVPELEIKDDVVVNDISNVPCSSKVDLSDLINNCADDETLCVDYDLNFTSGDATDELEVTPDMLEEGKQNNIVIVAYIVLPIKFRFDNDVAINVSELTGLGEEDLLDRSEASTEPLFGEGVKIKDVKIKYDTANAPFLGEVNLYINMYEGNEKTETLKKGDITIGDIDTLMSVYPLTPEIKMMFPAKSLDNEDNWISLPRNPLLKTKVTLEFTVDGKIEM